MKMKLGLVIAVTSILGAVLDPPATMAGCKGHTATAQLRSEVVGSISYDLDKSVLSVYLLTGRAYAYEGVPPEVFSAFVNTDHPGRFLSKNIRGRYPVRRLLDEECLGQPKTLAATPSP